jgi:T5SS/PEP-CTERM-associated repeat protein
VTAYHWEEPTKGGDWNDPQNWATETQPPPAGPPGAGDDVVIILTTRSVITTDGVTVASLTDNGATLDGDLTVTGDLALTHGACSGGAVVAGQFNFGDFDGTTLSAGSISGGAQLNSGTVKVADLIWASVNGGTVSAGRIGPAANTGVIVNGGTLSASSLELDEQFAGLVVNGGMATIGKATTIDGPADGPGGIIVSGGQLNLRGGLTLEGGAFLNDGSVTVASAGGVVSTPFLTVGGAGSGRMFVGGTNAHVKVTRDFTLGESGAGSLTVENGGHLVVDGDVESAVKQGSTATATISDAAADLSFANDWEIGVEGAATWTLGGAVSATVGGATELGVSSGGSGTLTLSDPGTTIVAGGGGVTVGGEGEGTLTVQSGAVFDGSAGDLTLGEAAGGKGTLQINDAGSELSVGDDTTVGAAGSGTFSITGGAATMSGTLTLGESQGASGTLTVNDGALTLAGDTTIGGAGKGSVTVGPDGVISPGSLMVPTGSTDTITLGENLTGKGTLTVKGLGAAVTSFGLTVGGAGVGSLTVADHARVITTGDAAVGDTVTANVQKVAVTSAGTWTVGGDLSLGQAAIATASVTTGGLVRIAGDLTLGEDADATGTLAVTGVLTTGSSHTPSRLQWGGVLDVGKAGTGTLTIFGGAQATAIAGKQGLVEIGSTAGSKGTVEIAGAGSDLTGQSLAVGGDLATVGGVGDLTIGSGAAAHFALGGVIWAESKIGVDGALTMGSTLDNGLLNAVGGSIQVTGAFNGTGQVAIGTGGSFTLDASKTTLGNRIRIDKAAGAFSLTGGSGNDLFRLSVAALKSQDAIVGGAGHDALAFTTAGTIKATAFSGVSGIDQIDLASGTNSLTVGNALAQASDAGALTIDGGAGNDTINASAVASGATLVFAGGGGHDAIHGGMGDNVYKVAKTPGTLSVTNSFTGGSAAHGMLQFGAGLTDQTLWFERVGSSLVIDVIGSADKVTLNGWYGANKSARVGEIQAAGLELDAGVAKLVSAMAAYSAGHPGFDPTAAGATMPGDAALQSAIAANWHH